MALSRNVMLPNRHCNFIPALSLFVSVKLPDVVEPSQAVKYFVYWQDKHSGTKSPMLLHCSSTEKGPSPDGPQQKGMGQALTGTTQSQGDAALHGMRSASHPREDTEGFFP